MYIDRADKPTTANVLKPARKIRINWLFVVTVVLPTVFASVYFGWLASDVYISESRFVVRSPDKPNGSPLGAILEGAGFSRAQDDTYAVHDFMESRDALRILNNDLNLEVAFGAKDIDIISRFDGFDLDDSFEALHEYFKGVVSTSLDDASGISRLTVRAFTSEDAWIINQKLIDMSEVFLNKLNDRARQDMIRFATSEVETAEEKAKAAALALAKYRNEKGVIDPEKQAQIPLQQIARLQEELIATKSRLVELQSVSPQNPQIPIIQKRIAVLEADIAEETSKVTGGNRSLADKASEYQRVALDSEFAEKQLATALASLEQARNEAQRKQLYLETVVTPNLPDTAVEPRRARAIIATFLLGLVTWGILTILIAGVREHRD